MKKLLKLIVNSTNMSEFEAKQQLYIDTINAYAEKYNLQDLVEVYEDMDTKEPKYILYVKVGDKKYKLEDLVKKDKITWILNKIIKLKNGRNTS